MPTMTETQRMGMNSISCIKLCSRDAPFVAHLVGFDGKDMFFGLVIAHELAVRLGHIHRSGLEVARHTWGIDLESQPQHDTQSLWQVLACHVVALANSNRTISDLPAAKLRAIRARLLVHLAQTPHQIISTAR